MSFDDTIATLFAKDPKLCTDEDLKKIVANFRAMQKSFNLGNPKAGVTKPLTGKAAETMKNVSAADIDL